VDGISATRATLVSGGVERTMVLVRPDTSVPLRALVIVLHGSNQTGEVVRNVAAGGFDELAASGAAVVAYPDGISRHWNDARAGIDFAARKRGIDDVAFLERLIDTLAESDGIDRSRVYVAGFSNGAAMVIRMLLQRSRLLAGAAIISATMPVAENLLPIVEPAHPVPVVLFHGTKDPLVPYAGGMASIFGLKPRGLGLSAPQTAAYFAERNGISVAPEVRMLPSRLGTAPTVELTEYHQSGHPEVRLYTIEGGGHVIPAPHRSPPPMGHTTKELVATEVIAEFFALSRASA
jgi:polyhydroxybutyrate depolymerase